MSAAPDIDMAMLEEPSPLSDAYRAPLPADAWLARRTLRWGGSEVAALLYAYGLAPLWADPPKWLTEQAEWYRSPAFGIPKIIVWKSGLRPRPKNKNSATDRGNDREFELFELYRARYGKHRYKRLIYQHQWPAELMPVRDPLSDHLAVTPDSFGRLKDGRFGTAELKCTHKPVTPEGLWHYRQQLEAEMGCLQATFGSLVLGEFWIQEDDVKPDGAVHVYNFAPNPERIALIRQVCDEAWTVVEQLRALADDYDAIVDAKRRLGSDQSPAAKSERNRLNRKGRALLKPCPGIWQASKARLAHHIDPEIVLLEERLADFPGLETLNYAA